MLNIYIYFINSKNYKVNIRKDFFIIMFFIIIGIGLYFSYLYTSNSLEGEMFLVMVIFSFLIFIFRLALIILISFFKRDNPQLGDHKLLGVFNFYKDYLIYGIIFTYQVYSILLRSNL